ncbi:MAG: T9SS type A sorting domain-containing protein [Bacteroidetes bacterium]|nr:T9SS type A sorting domain-containing protein [Bacteroidota bacterium]
MKTINTILIIFFIILTQNSKAQCWSQIAAGEYHTLAIKSDGTLWAWGNNDYGQLGDGTTINKSIPTQIGSDTDWMAIDAAGSNSMALKSNGTLWAWGNNNLGLIGDGNHGDGVFNTLPTQIGFDTDWVKFAIKSFAIKSNGTLWGWGYNLDGRLGTGDNLPHYTPVQIGAESDWIDINTGPNQNLALKSNHSLWGWGMNKSGSLAIGEPSETFIITTPTQTGNNSIDWQKIEVGGCCSSKMIKTDGSLWAMGLGSNGNLGNGDVVSVNTPTQVGIETDWNTISTSNHSCGIKSNGTLWAWGYNGAGQIGDGTTINRTTPVQVGTDKTWLSVKAGANYTVAISDDHTLYAWGYNNKGQLGDGTLQTRNTITQIGNSCPLAVADFKNFTAFSAVPNPTNNQTVVHFFAQVATHFTVTVRNVLGQTVAAKTGQSTFGDNREFIDLTAFSAGVYYITINTTGQQNVLKVVKK